ncbi:MAG: HepT-like ribonuclease domain-containing protein [Gemmatimonadales bacterium]
MLETARKAAGKAEGLDFERFVTDENLHLACVHLVQVIGEAASRVSAETRARHPSVPWRQVIGMRHRVVHDYLEVDLEIVWKVINADMPGLIAALERVATTE